MNKWWEEGCDSSLGCLTAFMKGDIVVWPVWRNPQDSLYWTFKVHRLTTDRWERLAGHLCVRHTALAEVAWEVDTQADVDWMERTDAWAIKNGGNI